MSGYVYRTGPPTWTGPPPQMSHFPHGAPPQVTTQYVKPVTYYVQSNNAAHYGTIRSHSTGSVQYAPSGSSRSQKPRTEASTSTTTATTTPAPARVPSTSSQKPAEEEDEEDDAYEERFPESHDSVHDLLRKLQESEKENATLHANVVGLQTSEATLRHDFTMLRDELTEARAARLVAERNEEQAQTELKLMRARGADLEAQISEGKGLAVDRDALRAANENLASQTASRDSALKRMVEKLRTSRLGVSNVGAVTSANVLALLESELLSHVDKSVAGEAALSQAAAERDAAVAGRALQDTRIGELEREVELLGQVRDLFDTTADLEDQLPGLQGTVQALNAAKHTLEAEISAMEHTVAELAAGKSFLAGELSALDGFRTGLVAELRTQLEKVAALETRDREMSIINAQLRTQMERQVQENERLDRTRQSLEASLVAATREVESARQQRAEAREEAATQRSRESSEGQATMQALAAKVSELEQMTAERETKWQTAIKEKQAAEKKVANMESYWTANMRNEQTQAANAKQQAAAARAALEEERAAVKALRAEMVILQARYERAGAAANNAEGRGSLRDSKPITVYKGDDLTAHLIDLRVRCEAALKGCQVRLEEAEATVTVLRVELEQADQQITLDDTYINDANAAYQENYKFLGAKVAALEAKLREQDSASEQTIGVMAAQLETLRTQVRKPIVVEAPAVAPMVAAAPVVPALELAAVVAPATEEPVAAVAVATEAKPEPETPVKSLQRGSSASRLSLGAKNSPLARVQSKSTAQSSSPSKIPRAGSSKEVSENADPASSPRAKTPTKPTINSPRRAVTKVVEVAVDNSKESEAIVLGENSSNKPVSRDAASPRKTPVAATTSATSPRTYSAVTGRPHVNAVPAPGNIPPLSPKSQSAVKTAPASPSRRR